MKPRASDGESLYSLATEAIAHIMIAAVDHGNTIPWMHAGIEDFESGHFNADTVRNSLALLAEGGNMPTISDMLELYYTYGNYRELSFSLIEFILHEYGPDKLKQLIEKPYDMETVFGLSQNEFKEKWAAYVLKTMEDRR